MAIGGSGALRRDNSVVRSQGPEAHGAGFRREPQHPRILGCSAQATVGLSHRAGLGKARHNETADLWIQVALEMHESELCRGGGYGQLMCSPAGAS